jgi:hypothetical protein
MRTTIDIPSDQLQHLDELAEQNSNSRAEAVRRAVEERLARDAGFGLWSHGIPPDAGRDGLRLQQTLREEWPF